MHLIGTDGVMSNEIKSLHIEEDGTIILTIKRGTDTTSAATARDAIAKIFPDNEIVLMLEGFDIDVLSERLNNK